MPSENLNSDAILGKQNLNDSLQKIGKIKEGGGCGNALISLIIPGAGQLIRGDTGKGIAHLVLAVCQY